MVLKLLSQQSTLFPSYRYHDQAINSTVIRAAQAYLSDIIFGNCSGVTGCECREDHSIYSVMGRTHTYINFVGGRHIFMLATNITIPNLSTELIFITG